MENAALLKWVQKNAETSKHVMSVCTGAFILAKAGLLDGLTATTVSHSIDELGKISPKTKVVRDQRYVDNGKIITTAGLSSGIDGAFHVIEKIKGRGEAQATALGMEYRWDPDSKFARAALADTYFPEFDGVDARALSTQGDSEHWEAKILLSQATSASAILEVLGKKIVAETPRTRGPVILRPASSSEIEWKFTDEQGSNWNGQGTVEPAKGQTGKFVVTLKLTREPRSTCPARQRRALLLDPSKETRCFPVTYPSVLSFVPAVESQKGDDYCRCHILAVDITTERFDHSQAFGRVTDIKLEITRKFGVCGENRCASLRHIEAR